MNNYSKENKCINCGQKITNNAIRCCACQGKRLRRPKKRCINCNKILKNIYAKRCRSCNLKRKIGKKAPNYKHGKYCISHYCIDCGKEISNYRAKRCQKCLGIFYSKKLKDKNNPNWRNANTSKLKKLRNTKKFSKWRNKIFERDDYTCQYCNKRGGYLEAHHIKSFAYFPKLRFKLSNGITLCKGCHKQTKTYASKNSRFKI